MKKLQGEGIDNLIAQLAAGLQNISSEPMKIADLKDGNLLLMVKNSNIAKKFLATKHLNGICKVNIDLHNTLNYSKGTIYAPCLNEIPESEIVENLKDPPGAHFGALHQQTGEAK